VVKHGYGRGRSQVSSLYLGTLVVLFTRLAKPGLVVHCRIASVTVLVALMHTVADLVGAGRECLDTRSSRQHAGGIQCDLWEEDKFVDQLVVMRDGKLQTEGDKFLA
jgi:hypothetical protein